jgi:NAD-specific glutamate dehydrogenase
MRGRVEEVIRSYRNHPPLPEDEVNEAIAFLDWIAADKFTFWAFANTASPSSDTAADPVEGSGLGILRDPRRARAAARQGTRGDDARDPRLLERPRRSSSPRPM